MTEPSRTVEVERKYDVDAETPLPDWRGLPGVESVTEGESRALDARYFDTVDGALARAGVALRRRTGGPDEGWHVKGPRQGDGRTELGWPLDQTDATQTDATQTDATQTDAAASLPEAVAAAVAGWTTEPVAPLARIENDRTAYLLIGPDGVVAEFVDDHVRATDLRHGATRRWREWEMELGPAAPADVAGREAFFAAVEQAVAAAGGRPSASGSKLARALGA